MRQKQTSRKGFTLIEVLIVVVILGILAATVLPALTSRSDSAKESALVQNLQTLRSQIQLYRFDHEGRLPTADQLAAALTSKTDIQGNIDPNGEFGPYIIGQLPPNPYNGLRTVKAANSSPMTLQTENPDGSTGWIYDERTGDIKANWNQPLSNPKGTSTNVFDL